jgi:hypothetical protein
VVDTNGTALLTGPKDRRAEFAITREMDEAVRILMAAGPWSRSDACRIIMARGIKAYPELTETAIEAARLSRERDAAEQGKHS